MNKKSIKKLNHFRCNSFRESYSISIFDFSCCFTNGFYYRIY